MKAGGHRTEDGLLEIRTIKSSVNYTSSGEFRTLFKAQRSSYLEHDYEKFSIPLLYVEKSYARRITTLF